MSSPIAAAFAAPDSGRALLIPYLTAGWPGPDDSSALFTALEEAGADLIEIGVPFSDPAADGPVIQRANEEAIANGVDVAAALDAASGYRAAGGKLPLVLMGYANTFFSHGAAKLAADCAEQGVDGVLAVDWPPAPGDGIGEELAEKSIDRIVLVAPSTDPERAEKIGAAGSGYAYYVSMQGVTGSAALDVEAVAKAAEAVRGRVGLPLAVGFGVRTPDDCRVLGEVFDAVIVGSRLIEEIRADPKHAADAAKRVLAPMREALG